MKNRKKPSLKEDVEEFIASANERFAFYGDNYVDDSAAEAFFAIGSAAYNLEHNRRSAEAFKLFNRNCLPRQSKK